MKLTWFSNTSFRVHIGGQILVVDADSAPAGVDRGELVSGADVVVRLDGAHTSADGRTWSPRPRQRLLEAGDAVRPVQLWSIGGGSLLVNADEDMPLLMLAGAIPALGRWAEKSVIVLVGQALADRASALLEAVEPRLIALAGSEDEVGAAFDAVRDRLDTTGLVALEPGMAVEA